MIVISRRRGRSNPLSVGAAGEPRRHRLDPGSFGEILSEPQAVCKVLTPARAGCEGAHRAAPSPLDACAAAPLLLLGRPALGYVSILVVLRHSAAQTRILPTVQRRKLRQREAKCLG